VPLLAIAFLLLVPVIAVLAMPFSIVQRYRVGTARRKARAWVSALNCAVLMLSAAIFVWAAAMTSVWVPGTFEFALLGIGGGALLGIIGLVLTRWEMTPSGLYYTPNRWLILGITLAVATRLLYGLWRTWHAWHIAGSLAPAAPAARGSIAVGGVVIGYYLIYSAGLWRRAQRRRYGSV
jgi:hypothetical protein